MSANIEWNPYAELLSANLSAESSWNLLFQVGEMLVGNNVFPNTSSRLRAEEYLGRMFNILENQAARDESLVRIRDLMYKAGTELRATYGDSELMDCTAVAGTIACIKAVQTGEAIDSVRRSLACVFMEQYKIY
jgi:hypothetical protein